jgi:hypothetical protein
MELFKVRFRICGLKQKSMNKMYLRSKQKEVKAELGSDLALLFRAYCFSGSV